MIEATAAAGTSLSDILDIREVQPHDVKGAESIYSQGDTTAEPAMQYPDPALSSQTEEQAPKEDWRLGVYTVSRTPHSVHY